MDEHHVIADSESQCERDLTHQEAVDLLVGKRLQSLHDGLRGGRLVESETRLHVGDQSDLRIGVGEEEGGWMKNLLK